MNFIKIGKIYTTHGLKGELKVKSSFKYKNDIYKNGFVFYCGETKEKLILNHYRKQNDLDLLIFNEIDNIDKGVLYRGKYLYINRDDLKIDLIDSDIIGFTCVFNSNILGTVTNITDEGHGNTVLRVKSETKEIIIPYNEHFISKINKESVIIECINLEGLL